MNWITTRLKEKSSQGGLGLVAVGLIIIFLRWFCKHCGICCYCLRRLPDAI